MKKGFTLAEVLIALGIIGVVAAVTLPGLNANVQKSQVGPAFMKAMNVLEQANMLATHENNARSLLKACDANNNNALSTNEYVDCISPYLNARPVNTTETYYESIGGKSFSMGQGMALKDGMVYGYYSSDYFQYKGVRVTYAKMFIDINGSSKGPNTIGRDVFKIYINMNTGRVFAKGSDAWIADLNEQTNHDWSSYGNGQSWRIGCNETEVKNPDTCAGSIADNNGKIIYPW